MINSSIYLSDKSFVNWAIYKNNDNTPTYFRYIMILKTWIAWKIFVKTAKKFIKFLYFRFYLRKWHISNSAVMAGACWLLNFEWGYFLLGNFIVSKPHCHLSKQMEGISHLFTVSDTQARTYKWKKVPEQDPCCLYSRRNEVLLFCEMDLPEFSRSISK